MCVCVVTLSKQFVVFTFSVNIIHVHVHCILLFVALFTTNASIKLPLLFVQGCGAGFINDFRDRKKVECPYCKRLMCFSCKKKVWNEE